ncbi:MAG: hypothetical protein NTY31_01175 [Candidatus Falkowbacteria bacterium]|nr:hypothetical protein [Candidatus Falkowbacteria bacterium]
MERNHGLELIMHKFTNTHSLLGDAKNYRQIFTDLKDVGTVFDGINAFYMVASTFTKNKKLALLLREIEFLIIKSVASYIRLRYEVELLLKYPDADVQKYYAAIKPLAIEDLLKRCNRILKKCRNLKERRQLK